MEIRNNNYGFKNADCLKFLDDIPSSSVDLIFTDPPFGLNESNFDKLHYKRDAKNVVAGYQEVPSKVDYEEWAFRGISKLDRILKPNGAILIISGGTHEADIQYAFRKTNKFKLINHLIWNFNFGVYTKNKFVSSHYHILYYCKNKGKPYFNRNINFKDSDKDENGKSLVYKDLQDVFFIKREFRHNELKNCNQLPIQLVEKLILHTTKENDVVLDLFAGSFTISKVALNLKRKTFACEINANICKFVFQTLASPVIQNIFIYQITQSLLVRCIYGWKDYFSFRNKSDEYG